MQSITRLSLTLCLALVAGLLAFNPVAAQDDPQDEPARKTASKKTKQSQTVSKEF